MTAALACLGLVLSLALLVYLINRRQGILDIPLMVGLLIGFAFAVVIGQIAFELTAAATPDLAKLIDTERGSRENDTKALNARLDEMKIALSTLTDKVKEQEVARDKVIAQINETIRPLNDQIKQLTETIKPLPGEVADHDARLKKLENPVVPPRASVALASAVVRIQAQTKGRPPTIQVVPRITRPSGVTILWAEISFCPLPSDGGACVPAPRTEGCARNLCFGQDGQYGTVQPPIASKPMFCVKVEYALSDNTAASLYGGPLTPTNGSVWNHDTEAASPCEPKSNHPGPGGA